MFRRMQTPRLMNGRSVCFPGFIFTREIVIHPLGEAEERPGPLFCSALIFSWFQDAMKSLRAQLPWQSFEERWSKSLATAVPSPNCSELCWAEDEGHIWCNQKYRLLFSFTLHLIICTLLANSTHILCHGHTHDPMLSVNVTLSDCELEKIH